jgi:hypothetical protein
MSALITGSNRSANADAVGVVEDIVNDHVDNDFGKHSRMAVFQTNWMAGSEVVGRATFQTQCGNQLVTLPLA